MSKKLVILVAEDDPNDLELLRHVVDDHGVQVNFQSAHDGEQVINYLRGDGTFADRELHPIPDILVLDLKMPRVNGFEVLQWLRQQPGLARIPAVVLSGSGLETDIEEAYRLGANTYFTKPGQLAELRKIIGVLIDYWRRSQRPIIIAPEGPSDEAPRPSD
jgi:CheY-like chemotaxis protein